MKTILFFLCFFSNLLYSQYITGLSLTQNGNNQLKANLKVYLPTAGNFLSSTTNVEQNTITLSSCYYITDFGAISNLENDFLIDLPNNGNFTLIVNMYSSINPILCNYENLEDTVSLNFTTPINGTVSLNTNEINNKEFLIYPIPVKDVLNFDIKEKITSLKIFDASGKLVYQNHEVNTKKIDVSNLKNGTYFLEIKTGQEIFYKKIMK